MDTLSANQVAVARVVRAVVLLLVLITAVPAFAQDADAPIKTPIKNVDAVALVIGISQYQAKAEMPAVEFAANDAHAIQKLLVDTFGYPEARVLLQLDAEASLSRIRLSIRQDLAARVVPGKSDVFVYFSGHGAPSVDTKEAYLLPWDYDPRYSVSADSAYALQDLLRDLGKLKARRLIFVVDACFSGQSAAGPVLKDASPAFIAAAAPTAAGLPQGLLITATGPDEIASWYREGRHSLLTYYLLRAFRGEADPTGDGRITVTLLDTYLKTRVPEAAQRLFGRKQTPRIDAADRDAVLVQLPRSALKAGEARLEARYGTLDITVDVGGELFLDNVSQGALPPGTAFVQRQLAAGVHQIEVRQAGYQGKQEQLTLAPGETIKRFYRLAASLPTEPTREKAFGLIQVSSNVGGALYLDERKTAELAPFEKYTTGRVEAGPHRVRVEKPAYAAKTQEVVVTPNETKAVTVELIAEAALLEGAAAKKETAGSRTDSIPAPANEAKALLARVAEGMGGAARVRGIKSIQVAANLNQGGMMAQGENLVAYPDRVRVSLRSYQGQMMFVVTPEDSFVYTPGQAVMQFTGPLYQDSVNELKRDEIAVLQHLDDPSYTFTISGNDVVYGMPVRVVDINAGGVPTRWWIDPAAGRVLRMTFPALNAQGIAVERTVMLGQWKMLGGVTLATRRDFYENGQQTGSMEIQRIELNRLPAGAFRRPAY